MQHLHFNNQEESFTPQSEERINNFKKINKLTEQLIILLILFLIVFSWWYLMLLNSLSTNAFALSELKSSRLEIQKKLEKLDIALTIPSSLYTLESSELVQEMPQVEKKSYIFIENENLAMR